MSNINNERIAICRSVKSAVEVVWYLMCMDEKAKVDRVVPDEDEHIWEIHYRCYDVEVIPPHVATLIKMFDSEREYGQKDPREVVMDMNANDTKIFQTLARYAYLKDYVIDDPEGLDMLAELAYQVIDHTTLEPPGPSSKVLNMALSYLDLDKEE